GANAVVIGSQLAGASESLGSIIERDGRKFKCYNASTSKTEKVRQYQLNSSDKTADYIGYVEGIESFVPYRGPVEDILSSLEKGIRSGLSYSGAFNIDEFHNKAQFIRVTASVTYENNNRGVLQL
ncbi:MAG TPA: IMP dehydrogenase, partial [Patescibacteria group bacterium]